MAVAAPTRNHHSC